MTRNRRETLLRTLQRHQAPVIVVDNGSTDGTAVFRVAWHHGRSGGWSAADLNPTKRYCANAERYVV